MIERLVLIGRALTLRCLGCGMFTPVQRLAHLYCLDCYICIRLTRDGFNEEDFTEVDRP